VRRASNATLAGRRYLDLQREAKRTGRPTDEPIQLYALECFLDRLVHSKFADTFILKGGVLLAALDARRPTRDIDFAARAIENTTENILVGGANNRRNITLGWHGVRFQWRHCRDHPRGR